VDFSARADRLQGSPEAAALAVETEDRAALMDSLILCKFLRGVFPDFLSESALLLRLVTGWDVTESELRTTAQRIIALKKLYNVREGWSSVEDTLPRRFLTESLGGGNGSPALLPGERLKTMIQAYYQARGWTVEGLIPVELAKKLALIDLNPVHWQGVNP
jgi:aldehyde:ferredoxin oxidoreductase